MTKLLFKLCFKASFEFHGILCEIDLFFLSFLTELYKIFYQTRRPLKKKRGGKELKSKNQRAETAAEIRTEIENVKIVRLN